MTLEQWLDRCDRGSGLVERHREALCRHYDSVEQIFALYLQGLRKLPGCNGRCSTVGLSKQFFIDVGVFEPAERRLFQACVRSALREDGLLPSKSGGNDGSEEDDMEEQLMPEGFRDYSFGAWLREVDYGSCELNCYLPLLQAQYASVEQVVQLYRERGEDGSCQPSSAFFHDIGLGSSAALSAANAERHWRLFRSWFQRRCMPPEGLLLAVLKRADASRGRVSRTPPTAPLPASGPLPEHRGRLEGSPRYGQMLFEMVD